MDTASRPSEQTETEPGGLPAHGERVVVRCAGFRCLAYRDTKGKWRNAHGDQELPEVIEVILRF